MFNIGLKNRKYLKILEFWDGVYLGVTNNSLQTLYLPIFEDFLK